MGSVNSCAVKPSYCNQIHRRTIFVQADWIYDTPENMGLASQITEQHTVSYGDRKLGLAYATFLRIVRS